MPDVALAFQKKLETLFESNFELPKPQSELEVRDSQQHQNELFCVAERVGFPDGLLRLCPMQHIHLVRGGRVRSKQLDLFHIQLFDVKVQYSVARVARGGEARDHHQYLLPSLVPKYVHSPRVLPRRRRHHWGRRLFREERVKHVRVHANAVAVDGGPNGPRPSVGREAERSPKEHFHGHLGSNVQLARLCNLGLRSWRGRPRGQATLARAFS
mmetsp:Transcript_78767/g.218945  ORF Transcript_78767/g.218945 Transcript_78767/m.218945 type:complete len:213 (-) Transcript_78767:821-1459(-)